MKRKILFSRAAIFVAIAAPAATINVHQCGATGNGSTDDTNAIKTCAAAAHSGDIVYFPPGQYRLSGPLSLESGIAYTGPIAQPPTAALLGRETGSGTFPIWQTGSAANSIAITYLTMDGGGINMTAASWAQNITIQWNTFQNIVNSDRCYVNTAAVSVVRGYGLRSSLIADNTFYNIFQNNNSTAYGEGCIDGIVGFRFDQTSIVRNLFDFVDEPIKILYSPSISDTGVNTHIDNNIFTRTHSYSIENQASGGWINATTNDNYMTNWESPYWDGPTTIANGSGHANQIVRGNVVDYSSNNTSFYGYAFEIYGLVQQLIDNAVVSTNSNAGLNKMTVAIGVPPCAQAAVTGQLWAGVTASDTYGTYPNRMGIVGDDGGCTGGPPGQWTISGSEISSQPAIDFTTKSPNPQQASNKANFAHATAGSSYSVRLTPSCGGCVEPYTFSSLDLPAGWTITPHGVLGGVTPAYPGLLNLPVQVHDAGSPTRYGAMIYSLIVEVH